MKQARQAREPMRQADRPPRATRSRHGRTRRVLARLLLVALVAGPAQAGTQTALGPVETAAGQGWVSRNELHHTTLTQDGHDVIYEWGRDIQQPADHTLQFIQRSSGGLDPSATALNRSPGETASHFFGRIEANGNLIFVNTAGIHFEDGSFVDVGGLIAAAGQLSNEDFLSGHYAFEGLGGEVTTSGRIAADSVALIGRRVANFGQIALPEGSLMMLAGDEIWLRQHGSPLIVVLRGDAGPLDAPPRIAADAPPAVENAGEIEAARVRMAAGDLLSFAIRQSGRVRADRITLEGGDAGLVEVSGTLDARNTEAAGVGGRIEVTGDWVSIRDDARIDASGEAGGGEVRIGGEIGGGPGLRAARGSYVGPRASVRADALGAGDGGSVAIWAQGTAEIYGDISARGGTEAGDGGFVETSGKRFLDVRRSADVSARSASGGAGNWLLDTNHIEILDDSEICGAAPNCLNVGLDDEALENPIFQSNPTLYPSVDDSRISASTIANALAAGSSVALTTQTAPGLPNGEQDGDITVNGEIAIPDLVASGANVTLTLRAANDLSLNRAIRNTNPDLTLNVHLIADDLSQPQNPAPESEVDSGFVGTLQLDADIITGGGAILLEAVEIDQTAGTRIDTDGGSFEADAFAGNVRIGGSIDTAPPADANELDGGASPGGPLLIRATAVRRALDQTDAAPTAVFGGDIVLVDRVATDAALSTGGGSATLTAQGGSVALDAGIDSGGGSVRITSERITYTSDVEGETDASAGGRLRTSSAAFIRSGGGNVDLSATIPLQDSQETQIELRGALDTRQIDALGAADPSAPGGDVTLTSDGERSRILVLDPRLSDTQPPATAQIVTNGGNFLSAGEGDLLLQGGVDTSPDASLAPEDAPGLLEARHAGDIEIVAPDAGSPLDLRAGDSAQFVAGTLGQGSLRFGGPTDRIAISADRITLSAGDGFSPDDETLRDSSIVLGDVRFSDRTGAANPEALFLIQDAPIGASGIPLPSQFANPDLSGLEYTLESGDGSLTLGDASRVARSRLSLAWADELVLQQALDLESLEGRAAGDLLVDTTLAARIDAAAPDITLAAGARANSTSGTLRVESSFGASDRLVLHAGSQVDGSLEFGSGVTLRSDDITLFAGDGSAGGTSTVHVGDASFAPGAGTSPRRFTLRQETFIDDATLPLASRFGTDVAGIDYRLRSDGANIALSTLDGVAKLRDSHLSLHAASGITLGSPLSVASLDVGGLSSFTYGAALNDQILFTDPASSRLVIRAGLASGGDLSFSTGSGLTISANQIRLVAGDGSGGAALTSRIALPASNLHFTPLTGTRLAEFVLRQDASFDQTLMPTLSGHFGGDLPDFYGVRSDDGDILIDDFVSDTLPRANSRLVLSAANVGLARSDGLDLDLEAAFGSTSLLQIRAQVASLEASAADLIAPLGTGPRVLPGAISSFTGFEAQPAPAGEIAADLDLVTSPASTPDLLEIDQDASIVASDLIDPTLQLGDNAGCAGDPACLVDFGIYSLTSHNGSIQVVPEKVAGSQLRLILAPLLDSAGSGSREIVFDTSGTPDSQEVLYQLASLDARHEDAWKLAGPSLDPSGHSPLRIEADDFIVLQAGRSGTGDLGFETGVTLQAQTIRLKAGLDLDLELGEASDPIGAPVVDARSGNPLFLFDNGAAADESPDTFFAIVSHGSLTDTPGSFTEATGLTPQVSQLLDSGTESETSLGNILFVSYVGDIQLERLNAIPASVPDRSHTLGLPADFIRLEAGSRRLDDLRTIGLGPSATTGAVDVDTDLTQFQQVVLIAPRIELSAGGQGFVKAESDSVFLRGPVLSPDGRLLAPDLLSVHHERAGFDESAPASGCSTGCLPRVEQFGPRFGPIEYRLESDAGAILLDETLAAKLRDSALTLLARDATGGGPDVRLSATPAVGITPGADLVLDSLHIGEPDDPAGPISIAMDTGSIQTEGDQTYNGNVTLERSLESTGANIAFLGTLRAPAAETRNLVLRTDAQVRFADTLDLGRSATDPSRLRLVFDRDATGTPSVRFGRDDMADLVVSADIQEFFAADRLAGFDTPVARATRSATLYKTDGRLEFRADEFLMNQGEKLSIAGDVVIRADSRVTLGDVSAFSLDVESPRIELVLRPEGQYLDIDGVVRDDAGLDFVTNDLRFSSDFTLTGSGRRPAFAIPNTLQTPDFLAGQTVTGIHADGSPLSAADFLWSIPDSFPDLHPEGPSRDDIASLFFDPQIVPTPRHRVPDRELPGDREMLSRLGIRTRPERAAELRGRLSGATLIDDVGSNAFRPAKASLVVSESRVLAGDADRAITLYEQIFGEHGENAEHVRDVLQRALERYRQSGASHRVVGFEFRRYIRNRPNSQFEAYHMLEDLDTLFTYHRRLGLTPGEYRPIQKRWLEKILPQGIHIDELSEAIHPSRYVRGSDILDIFGD